MPSTDDTSTSANLNISLVAFLAALSSVISIVEDAFLPLIPLPGVSFGLNNAVFLVNIDKLRNEELIAAQILKVVLAGLVFKGLSLNYFALSFSGAFASTAVLLFYRKFLRHRGFSLVSASALSSSAHITSQIAASSLILGSSAPFSYLPLSGTVSVVVGALVGAIANFSKQRIR